jgi:hypothetical protein
VYRVTTPTQHTNDPGPIARKLFSFQEQKTYIILPKITKGVVGLAV